MREERSVKTAEGREEVVLELRVGGRGMKENEMEEEMRGNEER